jgi:hypothetical protein
MKLMRNLDLRRCHAVLAGSVILAGAGANAAQPAPSASAAAMPRSGYFEYEQTVTLPAGRPLTTDLKLWFKGPSYRQESVTNGSKVVTVGGPNGTFVIVPGRADALKVAGPTHQNAAGIPGLPVIDSAAIQRMAKRVGTARVGRYQTDVYELTNVFQSAGGPKGQKSPTRQTITTRYWTTRDLPVPVKVSVPSMQKGSGPVVTILKSARLNLALADGLFQLPKGMKVTTPPPPHPPAAGKKG